MEAAQASPVRRRKRRLWLTILAVLLPLALAGNVVLALKYRSAEHNNPLSQQQRLLDAVAQDVIVPHEMPVVSTVADKAKLGSPALAAVVQNGDKILVYGASKRLIVYRPSAHKVVTMLTIQDVQGSTAGIKR